VLAVLLPFFFGSYRVGQFTQAMALGIAVLGLNLLVGYSGQISLGHGAFFALGAYSPRSCGEVRAGRTSRRSRSRRDLLRRGLRARDSRAALARALPRAGDARVSRWRRRKLIKRFDGLTGGTQGLSAPAPAVPGWASFLPTTSGCTC
jgi:branched-chain amino acid transport system permease protein